uniref:Uncharacterized protein n=1 Tax=Anguilla anguilla TaxID=7936 RepID=A0A0E9W2Q8_ANGAN
MLKDTALFDFHCTLKRKCTFLKVQYKHQTCNQKAKRFILSHRDM